MPDLADGQSVEFRGSAAQPYILKNVGGIYSCSCPSWRNQSTGIERRTCKHLRSWRGDDAERIRLGGTLPASTAKGTGKTKTAKPVAPPLLLANNWTADVDPTGWWLSEKLDGVRAYFQNGQFYSRQGNRFYAPAWFTASLPTVTLDGELWLARKKFQRTVSIVRRQDASELWRELRFVVFDAPAYPGPFEERLRFLQHTLAECEAEFAVALDQQPCTSVRHLYDELRRIESWGGEGLMLRQPGSRYEAGRSSTLLKVKRFLEAEGRIVGHQPGTGRHQARLGAVLVEFAGLTFAVGSGFTDAQREDPPAIGSLITFRYQELTDRGVPRFPTFVRVRSTPGQLPL